MPERTSKVKQEYAGRLVEVGERFEVEQEHVTLLLGLDRIEREPGDPAPQFGPKREPTYQTREMKAPRGRRGG